MLVWPEQVVAVVFAAVYESIAEKNKTFGRTVPFMKYGTISAMKK